MIATDDHVLIISFGYHPIEHVSGTRSTYMARELAALGREVSVLTVDWSRASGSRPRSVSETVRRALRDESPRVLAIDGRLVRPDFDPHSQPPTTEPPPPDFKPLRKLRTLKRMLRWGQLEGWARLAYAAAERLHRERPIRVAWAIHGDDSSHAIAYRLRRRLGVPWIADFKDPWDAYYRGLALSLQRRMTARRLRTARAVTETCGAQANADKREFSVPTHVVYSGYDAELMASAEPERPGDGFCIAYLGGFGSPLHNRDLLPAIIEELKRRGSLERFGMSLHQYGRTPSQFLPLLERLGCSSMVRGHDRVPRSRAFGLMRGADALLLFPMTKARGKGLGLKEIEYLASGTPVLILGEPLEELRPLIEHSPQARIATTAAAGADFLETEALSVESSGRSVTRRGVNPPVLREFTWREQAERLSRLLSAN